MEDCRDVALTVLPNIFPIDMKEHCIEGSSFMNHFAKSFRQNFAFESYKVESVPDWIFSNICAKWLQFWSEPSEILNSRSSNTPETVAFMAL